MASPRTAASTGEYLELSELTGLETFITNFAGHIAAQGLDTHSGRDKFVTTLQAFRSTPLKRA